MNDDLVFSNYCAAFLDLLGQRDSMRGQDLLHLDESGHAIEPIKKSMIDSVGKILSFQKDADIFLNERPETSVRDSLEPEQRQSYDEVKEIKMKRQRWSDGLVLYTTMQVTAPMNAIYEVMFASACLCFQQLAKKAPIRGGLDISWGAELHDEELYGAIVANSYALESEVAQYPRIVVSDRLNDYLHVAADEIDNQDPAVKMNAALAEFCKGLLIRDLDGFLILDYLGPTIYNAIGEDVFVELHNLAKTYAHEQYDKFRDEKNSVLAARYNWLVSYLENRMEADV